MKINLGWKLADTLHEITKKADATLKAQAAKESPHVQAIDKTLAATTLPTDCRVPLGVLDDENAIRASLDTVSGPGTAGNAVPASPTPPADR